MNWIPQQSFLSKFLVEIGVPAVSAFKYEFFHWSDAMHFIFFNMNEIDKVDDSENILNF